VERLEIALNKRIWGLWNSALLMLLAGYLGIFRVRVKTRRYLKSWFFTLPPNIPNIAKYPRALTVPSGSRRRSHPGALFRSQEVIMAWKAKKLEWKPIVKKVLAVIAAIFIPGLAIVVGVALAAVVGQQIGNSVGGALGGNVGVLIGAVVGIASAGLAGIAYFTKKTQTPEADLQQPEPTLPAANPSSVTSDRGRYVCNTNSLEIHDTRNLQPACHFDAILESHKIKLDSIAEVEEAIRHQGYNGCRWCMSRYDTG